MIARHCLYLIGVCWTVWAIGAEAVEKIELLALTKDKAIVRVDGKRKVLKTGVPLKSGVELIEASTSEAAIRVNGVVETFPLGMVVSPIGDTETVVNDRSLTLFSDTQGFFYADGVINGHPVRFLIDTGANTVAISGDMARRLGVDLNSGRPGTAQTASGRARMVSLKLATVRIGDITQHDVDAAVILGSYPPIPLLGQSFLNSLDMKREGNRMELLKRF